MFSLQIVDTDAFLDMPLSSHALYFHLSMRADDDGFVSNPKKIMKSIGCQDDDFKILSAKRFILGFESGIIVIKHWRLNNYIRKDRYEKTAYLKEKKMLKIKENGAYTEVGIPNDNQMTTIGTPSIDKIRLDKVSIAEPCSADWDSKEYINKLLEDNNRHINIIGKYFLARDISFPSLKAILDEIKRWVKDASILAEYTDEQITTSYNHVAKEFPELWNLSTIKKYINKK